MKSKLISRAAFYSWSLIRTGLLCGLLSLPAHAVNPDSPTDPGKTKGEEQETSDEEEDPSSDDNSDCDGGSEQTDPNSSSSCGDCPPESESGNGGSGNDPSQNNESENGKSENEEGDVGCIAEAMPLAVAPNEPGLGVGKLNLYITAADENLASLRFLEYYGLPQMSLTKTGTVGAATKYDIVQAGSTKINFVAPNAIGAVGNPVGASAYSLARLQHVDATGSVAPKETATFVKHFRSSAGFCNYPIEGGKAVGYETKAGRAYAFPLVSMEVIRLRADGVFVVNGQYGNGFIRQVKTVAGLMDVVSLSARSYEIRKYAPVQIGAKSAGLWTVSGLPIDILKIEAPVGTTTQLITTRTIGTRRMVNTYNVAVVGTSETWSKLASSGGFSYEKTLKREALASLGPDYTRVTRSAGVISSPAGTTPSGGRLCYGRVSDTYKNFPNKSTETFGTGIVAIRERSCVTPPSDPNGVGRVKSGTTSKNATWTADYDPASARMNSKVSSCVAPPRSGGTTIPTKTQTYDYSTSFFPTPPPGDFRPRKTTTTTGTGTAN